MSDSDRKTWRRKKSLCQAWHHLKISSRSAPVVATMHIQKWSKHRVTCTCMQITKSMIYICRMQWLFVHVLPEQRTNPSYPKCTKCNQHLFRAHRSSYMYTLYVQYIYTQPRTSLISSAHPPCPYCKDLTVSPSWSTQTLSPTSK